MGKFPIADRKVANTLICKKCKARNSKSAVVCRKCDYPNLRVKRARKKEGKSGK
jgi:large subunit ribosomal protein L40e